MLEQYRKAGKPIPPQVEKMAAWLDKMDAESAQDVPMVKPGVWLALCRDWWGGGGIVPHCGIQEGGMPRWRRWQHGYDRWMLRVPRMSLW